MRSNAKGKATVGSVEDNGGGLVNSIEQVCEEFNDFCCGVLKRRVS